MGHNRQLDELLTRVKEMAENAGEEKDFKSVFSLLRGFRDDVGPIRYDNRVAWSVFAAIAALGGGSALAYFLHSGLQQELGVWGYGILGAFIVALLVTLAIICSANDAIGEISDLIFRKDVFFDNRLKRLDVEGEEKELYRQFKEAFGDFRNRGDEGRRIKRLINGIWSGEEYSFPYDYYVFRYVRVYYVPVTRKVGKTTITTMERRTETLYRYGLILDFPFIKGIATVSGGGSYDYPESFQPTSKEFNDVFSVGALSAHDAAKFLKPAVVLAFLELAEHLSRLNVEINRGGRMNIAFSDSDVLDLERKFSIAQPDEFEREILSRLELPKLRRLLRFVETLKKHNDSNF